ncbi:MAG: type II secretion system F family protein [Planctomycetota bacterium]
MLRLPSTVTNDPEAPDALSAEALTMADLHVSQATPPRGWLSSGVKPQDVADVTAQLSIMTQSGVDIATAMGSLASQCTRPALAEVLEQVRDDVLAGVSFSDALRRHPSVFDAAYVATVGAGEATGRMPEIFAQLADLKRSELRLRRTIRSLLIYPVLLASVSAIVIASLVMFVLPQFAEIFDQYETPMPAITRALLAVAAELSARWWLWAPVAIGGVVAGVSARFTEQGKAFYDRIVVEGPGIGEVCQKLSVGRMCRLMGLMIESGVPLLEALQLVGKSMKNHVYRELMTDLEEAVVNGQGLTASLEESPVFPPAAAEMIGTAERSGKLGEVLRMVGAYFEEEGEASARTAVSALEPLITVGMGAVVSVVVLAVMLPVFDLATVAKSGY